MPYSTTLLSNFVSQISDVLGDRGQSYWTAQEIQFAVWEALRLWGAFTNYWRSRGTFNVSPASTSPIYSLPQVLPDLRTQVATLGQMVQEIQYMLVEAPNGISGAGMSGQFTVSSILSAIQGARNRFIQDAGFPITVYPISSGPPPPQGTVLFPQSVAMVHRVSWQDQFSGAWTNLWREDTWVADHSNVLWTISPGQPKSFSEADNAPLKIQIIPPPAAEGGLEILTVDSLGLNLIDPATTFAVPDEWSPAIKYGALARILSEESQVKNAFLAQYSEQRYQQTLKMTKDASSVIRVLCDGVPLPLDTMANLDSSSPRWRNKTGRPKVAGSLYDTLVISPGVPDTLHGIGVDVTQSAPLPGMNDYIQVGQEILNPLMAYVCHVLTFKCGGAEFKSTMGGYDGFMAAVAVANEVNAARIEYFSPLFNQPQYEMAQRPDRLVHA